MSTDKVIAAFRRSRTFAVDVNGELLILELTNTEIDRNETHEKFASLLGHKIIDALELRLAGNE
jgi:hypothetical protein